MKTSVQRHKWLSTSWGVYHFIRHGILCDLQAMINIIVEACLVPNTLSSLNTYISIFQGNVWVPTYIDISLSIFLIIYIYMHFCISENTAYFRWFLLTWIWKKYDVLWMNVCYTRILCNISAHCTRFSINQLYLHVTNLLQIVLPTGSQRPCHVLSCLCDSACKKNPYISVL